MSKLTNPITESLNTVIADLVRLWEGCEGGVGNDVWDGGEMSGRTGHSWAVVGDTV